MILDKIILIALFLSCNIEVIRSIDPDCDLVWRDVCYKYFTQQKNWYDADSSCLAWGGGLVNLSSQRTINVATAIQPDSSSAWVSNANSTACGYLKINAKLYEECSMLLDYICSKSIIDEPPTNLTLVQEGATSVTLTWLPPNLADPADNITHYVINYSGLELDTAMRNTTIYPSNTFNTTNITNASNINNGSNVSSGMDESYTLTKLEEHTTYTVHIIAFSRMRGRTGEVVGGIRTPQYVPSGVPLSIRATALSATTLFITWLPPNASLINGIITNFTLQYNSTKRNGPQNVEKVIPVTQGMNNFYHILDELTYGGPNYTISIAANTVMGQGPFSAALTAQTQQSATVAPRNLIYTVISATTVQLSWESPLEKDIDGIPQEYIVTYRGFPLDNVLHNLSYTYNSSDQRGEAVLEDLQENTTYSISVFLIVSGMYSPAAKLTVSTRDTVPSQPVQNLVVNETSQFSAVVFWQSPPLRGQNARILYYSVTTVYTDPSTSIPQLIDNFSWTNITYNEYIILRYLWHSVNFTVTVAPVTQHGMGPNASTTFLLRKETIPDIYNPMRDQFITIENFSEFRTFDFDCAAEGNPTPLINWYRRDGSDIKNYQPYSHNVSFTTNDLKSNQTNVYICNASNRVESVLRTVTVNVITENIALNILNDTVNQIDQQPSVDNNQASNITLLVNATLTSADMSQGYSDSVNCSDIMKQDALLYPNCFNNNSIEQVRAAAEILPQVTTKLEQDGLDRQTSEFVFSVNAKAIQSSLEIQDGTTQSGILEVACRVFRESYRTEISVSNSIFAFEVLIPKIVSAIMNNSSNLTLGEANSTVYSESVLIQPENVAEIDNITFPTSSLSDYRQRVVVPSDLLLSLPNHTNTTNTSTLISTTVVGDNSSTGYNRILTITFTQKSYNFSRNITQLSKNISLHFPSQPPPPGYELICVFFNSTTREWSDVGVRLLRYDKETNNAICTTNHLSTFAVLIRTRKAEESKIEKLILSVVSYALMSISFISLFIVLILYTVARKHFFKLDIDNKVNQVPVLYFNQTLALFFATGVFIFGIEVADRLNDYFCLVVAALLHYFWIAALAWSLCIGIYTVYVSFTTDVKKIWKYMMILGWGFPLPFVVTSLATRRETYINKENDYCWLSTDGWVVWLFLGPIYFIIIVNIFLFILIIVKYHSVKIFKRKTDLRVIMDILSKAIILTFVLALPWVVTLVKIITHFFKGDEASALVNTILDWTFILLNFPAGITLLIYTIPKYLLYRKKSSSSSANMSSRISKSKGEPIKWNVVRKQNRRTSQENSASHTSTDDKAIAEGSESMTANFTLDAGSPESRTSSNEVYGNAFADTNTNHSSFTENISQSQPSLDVQCGSTSVEMHTNSQILNQNVPKITNQSKKSEKSMKKAESTNTQVRLTSFTSTRMEIETPL